MSNNKNVSIFPMSNNKNVAVRPITLFFLFSTIEKRGEEVRKFANYLLQP
jgi:hypothetical protein